MVLAKRIIPCLDVKDGRVVKGVNFINIKDAGDPVLLGKRYSDEGADELIFLDITASVDKRKIMSKMVKSVASELNIPFTVGGGIRGVDDARLVLCNGADKISVNTAAVKNPKLISALSNIFGEQCVVVAIDVKRKYEILDNKEIIKDKDQQFWFEVYTHGGRVGTKIDALQWVREVQDLGAGELLITSMDSDGTKDGYDLALMKRVSEISNIPNIASGGCGNLNHFHDVLTIGCSDAALAASIFHYKELTIKNVKNYLYEKGVSVRI